MKTAAVAATVVASLAGLAAANPVAEPQGFGWWNRRPTVYATVTVTVPAPSDAPDAGSPKPPVDNATPSGTTKPAEPPKAGGKGASFPFYFTSTYAVVATPDQVINGTVSTPGEPGAIGYYNYGINSDLEVLCYVSTSNPNAEGHRG